MRGDNNLCEHCNLYHPISARVCDGCGQPLVLDAIGKIAIWRLGDIGDGLLGPVAASVCRAFGYPVVIQPGFIDERPSLRPNWNGRSATTLINQMKDRRKGGVLANLCVTEDNITLNRQYNFLFGLAWLGLGAATMGIEPMRADDPAPETLITRMCRIAIHELGHAFGLDDMPYEHGHCVMCGEIEYDSIATIDAGTMEFCRMCRSGLIKGLRKSRRRA